ncbi:uncharacterized protein [Drosophila virilis]|uniref:Uncharacterized protein n=1 Tax=Drosophila virilis TaxID=7244 RepID=B4LD82_DROVI|nr:uncharacterized protein LOC6623876 [Drosophila virilis]EDW70989.2 uncharacterized protein Dvir_GJ14087 [Drosophila virilis]
MWKSISYVVMFLGLLELSRAQRPSFAGARPPGGLSQKDKYHAAQNTAVENITGVDIATRFGEDAVAQQSQTINLAYGAAQRPPMGVPLVLPISSYVPDVASIAPTATSAAVDFANRVGGTDGAVNTPIAGIPNAPSARPIASVGSFATARPIASVGGIRPVPNALPIDAHGDQDYVNHLSQLPVDNQPFWFLNYQAIESLRNSSRPNVSALENRGSFFAG